MIQAKKRAKFRTFIFPLLLFLGTIMMGVGYAAIGNVDLDITGSLEAKLQPGVFITDVSYYSDNAAGDIKSEIKNYFGTVVNTDISLSNTSDSTVTFKLTLYNSTKSVYTYMGLNYDDYFYSNSNIKATVSGINVGDKVLGKSYKDVYLTFSYDEGAPVDDGNLEAFLRLLFEKLPPEFSVIGNPVNWVNTDVTLEVVPSNNIPVDFYEYSFDGGNTWSTTNTKSYTENTDNIDILIRDYDGFISDTYSAKVDRIDKVVPTIYIDPSIYNDCVVTLGDSYTIKDFITVSDDASGINDSMYTVTRNDGTNISNTNEIATPGYYNMNIYVEDNAGNVAELDWQILVRWPTGARYVLARQNVISSGNGLYADNSDTGLDSSLGFTSTHYYVGTSVNNYINFSGVTFRIISLSQNNTVKLIGDDIGRLRYTPSLNNNNRFFSSKNEIRKKLVDLGNSGNLGYTTLDFNYVETGIFYIGGITKGKRGTLVEQIVDERTNDAKLEGNSTAWSNNLGMCTATEWAKSAGLIKPIEDLGEFVSLTWLDIGLSEWTITANSNNSTGYWRISDSANGMESSSAYTNSRVRPVFFLKSDTIISGTGTDSDPFAVQENWDWFDVPTKQNLQ